MPSDVTKGLVDNWKFDGSTNDSVGRNEGARNTIITSMEFASDDRLSFDEKNTGGIRIMTADQRILDQPFASVDDLYFSWEQRMLGLTLDPHFDQNNYVYLY